MVAPDGITADTQVEELVLRNGARRANRARVRRRAPSSEPGGRRTARERTHHPPARQPLTQPHLGFAAQTVGGNLTLG